MSDPETHEEEPAILDEEDEELVLPETESASAPAEENILDDLLLNHQNDDHMFAEEKKGESDDEQENHLGTELIDSGDDEPDEDLDRGPAPQEEEGSGRSDISEDEGNLGQDEPENDRPHSESPPPPPKKHEKIEAPPKSDDDDDEAATSKEEKGDAADQKQQVKKKGKSYDYATKLNYLFRDARFFLVKSNNAENVALSKAKGVWSTPPANEARFNQAFNEARNVLLVFSVKESGKFAGMARLATAAKRDGPQVAWVLPPGKLEK